jgi:NitT/TauT family transport system substrate-binding protein
MAAGRPFISSRRRFIVGAAAAFGAPALISRAEPAAPLKLTFNAGAVCTSAAPVAVEKGFFRDHGLNVELVNFAGSTDQLLEALATGKADAGIGMALRWLKPLEQGFDVKITAGIHGGCIRLLAPKGGAIANVAGLKGKTIGVGDLAGPDKNFFSIVLKKQGIDPERDVAWRQYPGDLLGVALQKGEVQAIAFYDPQIFLIKERDDLQEIYSNMSGEYQHRVCCILGLRGSLIRQQPAAATALTKALLEAGEWVANNPAEAAAIYAPYGKAPVSSLTRMLESHSHHHHPMGTDLKGEIVAYAEELKLVDVLRANTDPVKFADRVYADVLS